MTRSVEQAPSRPSPVELLREAAKQPALGGIAVAVIITIAQITNVAIRANNDVDQQHPGLTDGPRDAAIQRVLETNYQLEQLGTLATAALGLGLGLFHARRSR